MKRFIKFVVAMLAMVAMMVGAVGCSKDDNEKDGGSKTVGISYDALFDKMWVINEEQGVYFDEETGETETWDLVEREYLELDCGAVEMGLVHVYEKLSETSRFVQVKSYTAVGENGRILYWIYAAFDKTTNKFHPIDAVHSDEELAKMVELELEYWGDDRPKVVELTDSKFALMLEDKHEKITDIFVPESSWHGMSRQQLIDKCVPSDEAFGQD